MKWTEEHHNRYIAPHYKLLNKNFVVPAAVTSYDFHNRNNKGKESSYQSHRYRNLMPIDLK